MQRLCQQLEISTAYAQAYNTAQSEPRDSWAELIQSSLPSDLMGHFLNIIYTDISYAQKENGFYDLVTSIVVDFLHWTKGYPDIREISTYCVSFGGFRIANPVFCVFFWPFYIKSPFFIS